MAGAREDFVFLVQSLTQRNEPEPVADSMGACIVAGYNNWDRVAERYQATALSELVRSGAIGDSRETLLENVWGDSTYRDPRTVDVHIRHLREKIEQDAKHPEYLFTVRGVGYRFRDAERDK